MKKKSGRGSQKKLGKTISRKLHGPQLGKFELHQIWQPWNGTDVQRDGTTEPIDKKYRFYNPIKPGHTQWEKNIKPARSKRQLREGEIDADPSGSTTTTKKMGAAVDGIDEWRWPSMANNPQPIRSFRPTERNATSAAVSAAEDPLRRLDNSRR